MKNQKTTSHADDIIIIIALIALCLFFFFLCNPAHAGLYGRIEGGKDVDTDDIYYTAINIGYKFSVFGIQSRTFGGWMTWHQHDSGLKNYPFSETYTIGQSLHFKGFFIEANHYCNHRVISEGQRDNEKLYKHYGTRPGTMSIIKIGYEWEIK